VNRLLRRKAPPKKPAGAQAAAKAKRKGAAS
jgi:hypothetical protein